jgi:hypothetical protein
MTSTAKTAARREAIIIALLVIVGAVLAFVLFAAGALWRGRSSAGRHKTSINTPAEAPALSFGTSRANDDADFEICHLLAPLSEYWEPRKTANSTYTAPLP